MCKSLKTVFSIVQVYIKAKNILNSDMECVSLGKFLEQRKPH